MKKCLLIIAVVAMLAILLAGCGSKPPVPDASGTSGAPQNQKAQDIESQPTKKPTAPATGRQVAPNVTGAVGQKELRAQEKTKDLAVVNKDQSPPAPPANKDTLADLPSPAAVRGKMEAVYFTRGKPVITVGSEPFTLNFIDVCNKYDREIDVQIVVLGIENPKQLDPKKEYVLWEDRVKPGETIQLPVLKYPKQPEDLLRACLEDTQGIFGKPFFAVKVNGSESWYVAELARTVKDSGDHYEIYYFGDKKEIRPKK